MTRFNVKQVGRTIKEKDGKVFRGKGKDVKKCDVLKMMRDAAKKGRTA